jgi:GR25 family glycosyltransferase involved in LPS biosynthesis
MKIKEFTPGGFYINLDYREDRNLFIQQELSKYDLFSHVLRLPAIKAFDSTQHIINDSEKMLKASTATAQSHIKAIQIAKRNNWDKVLILEDDAQFYNTETYQGIDVIEQALDQLNTIPDWEVFYLGANLCDETLVKVDTNLIKCDCCYSTQAYILNSSTFDRILEEDTITHMDVFLNRHFKNSYIPYPLALIQKSDDISDIGGHKTFSNSFWENQYNKPIAENE